VLVESVEPLYCPHGKLLLHFQRINAVFLLKF
jgi:hypothetical protein